MSNSRSRLLSKTRSGNALVVLSWGAVAWYRSFPLSMTIGELRRQLAKELGRIFGGQVVGLELFSTGTEISPDLSLPLQVLTHPPYQTVCLDVAGGPRQVKAVAIESVGERLLRKQLHNEKFQCGVAQQLWRLIQLEWPYVVFGIHSTIECEGCEIGLRLNLEKYPLAPPLVQLWDIQSQTAIEAQRWPEPFIRFASQNYPRFVDLETMPYCENVLHVSIGVVRLQKNPEPESWDVKGDLTQILSRVSGYFRRQPRSSSQFLRARTKSPLASMKIES